MTKRWQWRSSPLSSHRLSLDILVYSAVFAHCQQDLSETSSKMGWRRKRRASLRERTVRNIATRVPVVLTSGRCTSHERGYPGSWLVEKNGPYGVKFSTGEDLLARGCKEITYSQRAKRVGFVDEPGPTKGLPFSLIVFDWIIHQMITQSMLSS
jgi:hypothetical protein